MSYILYHIPEEGNIVATTSNCRICNKSNSAYSGGICESCGNHIIAGDFNVGSPISVSYKIRRKSDGLYSTGGANPNFTKKGKSWAGIGQLKNHLNVIREYSYSSKVYTDCEIVAYEETPPRAQLREKDNHSSLNDLLREFST